MKENITKRSEEQIKHHYEIEKELAARLMNSQKQERLKLYSSVYDELYLQVPDHPMLNRTREEKDKLLKMQLEVIHPFLDKKTIFAEIGAGGCDLCFKIADSVKKIYAIDITDKAIINKQYPDNFKFVASNGLTIPLKDESVDIIFSNQLMEHLHPDDAMEQLKEIQRVLKKGGKYICITPSRIYGPHDISKFFTEKACGLHLKEWSGAELIELFRKIGFRRVKRFFISSKQPVILPAVFLGALEYILECFKKNTRLKISSFFPIKLYLGGSNIRIIAEK